ncbi:MAG: MBL fold metallo-hydrolase [Coriobacteriia bacterium]|nr:MBL fold metallo-hydrolase [Coriobacteriia bacterium]
MRVTVLGSAASYAGPGQACAGYLIRSGEALVLTDCGNGVLANLGRVADPLALDAVIVTHRHPDHVLDLFSLQSLLRYAPQGPAPALPLYGPPGLMEMLGCMHDEKGRAELAASFEFEPLRDGEESLFGALSVRPVEVDHVDPTFALRLADDGGTMCYTSDTRYGEAVLDAARGCDLLLADATMPEAYAGRAPHMSAGECGRLASEAGAGRLVLTHVWPTNDRIEMAAQARRAFGGPVEVAEELADYDVG